ncbi:MAG TPA: hypothetical protein VNA66_09135 [Gammaproteobacteria bacterium]|jgi:hypothetical protein|nr:hypothetical protein [Gammaproteobacteria bacterium]
MMALFASIERMGLSVWVRESPSLLAFPFILFLHTLGLAMLAGLNVGLDAWLLGRRKLPPFELPNIYRVMWLGFGINALSGLALLAAYPAKALTNWVFFVKLLCIAIALWVLQQLKGELVVAGGTAGRDVSGRARRLALASLLLWTATIFAGRLLAYTHHILLASEGL